MERIRISYAKTEGLRYTSNLDVHKVWERLLRRAKLPLAYSQGFHPQPRLNQAAPLPLGIISQAEMIDVWLEEDIPVASVKEALIKAAPPGLLIHEVALADPKAPALPTIVRSSEYVITLLDQIEPEQLQIKLDWLLALPELVRERRGKSYDLRPLIEDLSILDAPGEPMRLCVQLSVREGATGRPDEVVLALGLDPYATRIERTRLFMD
ncbi:MAG TPA: TIGR03936 family radical SAM-associated protein [Anaerolineaceae bacterium]|nr:TIGR03936 family radical SAM-associated protein [Anaerolineaceae bacterium]